MTRPIKRARSLAALPSGRPPRGLDVRYIHRVDRTGFKAGALAEGLRQARGDLIALFDADFVPSSDFSVEPSSRSGPPGRDGASPLGHLNRDFSLLTRVQALLLMRISFWSMVRGIAEDFSSISTGRLGVAPSRYRERRRMAARHPNRGPGSQLPSAAGGLRFVFLEDLVAPAEIPVEMDGFKTQQQRWARGSVQTCFKLLPRLLRSRIPRRTKIEAMLHLTSHFHYPALLVLALVMVPALFIRARGDGLSLLWADVPLFAAATASVVNFHA